MIKKIISIKSVGLFNNFQAVELKKFNIIYGENGRGKSTLSIILRSLCSGDPRLILERKTLDSSSQPEIRLLLEPSIHTTFKDGKWDRTCSDVEIFDSYFISNNVYSGDAIDIEHRRNLHQFVIGQDGVKNANIINHCAIVLKSIDSLISTCEGDIKRNILGTHIDVSTFVEMELDLKSYDRIGDEIIAKKKIVEALKKAKEIREKDALYPLSIPEIPRARLELMLSKTLDDVSKSAEKITHEHFNKCVGHGVENWIQTGLAHMTSDVCPFCGQTILKNSLIKAYRHYFDATYISFKKEIHDFSDETKKVLSDDKLLAIQRVLTSNDLMYQFWNEYIIIEYKSPMFADIQCVWNEISLLIEDHLKRKELNPLELMDMKSDLLDAFRTYKFLLESANTYNQNIKNINILIAEKKKSIGEGDLNEAERNLELLQNKQIRLRPEVDKLCRYYKQLLKGRANSTNKKNKAKSFLDSYTPTVFSEYESTINGYLEACGAGFKIEEVKTTYAGGKASVIYKLSIRGTTVDLSMSKSATHSPCFKNTLSEGDKSTLAFIFFLAKLDHDSNTSNKIIVFDDPVSSLDGHRRSFTQQQIIRLSQCCKQVIILTHDLYLARQIFDNARVEISTLQIKRKGDASAIEKWDIETDIRSDYFKNYDVISDYLERGSRDSNHLAQVARCIRPLLEGYLRIKYPKEFGQSEWLGNFVDKIRNAKNGDLLYSMQLKLGELEDINDYSKKYHHENPADDSEHISDTELQSYSKRTLNLIQS